VADRVADEILRHHAGVRVVGVRHGYFTQNETSVLMGQIRAARPDLLLTALGAPRQELFNDAFHRATGVPVVMGVGGLFNFVSGRIPRAPLWMRRLSIEWVHRLAMEPRRMWKRYVLGNARFLVRELHRSRRAAAPAPMPPRRAA
jgi:N-acetylglucosaminyldiphosphoundecaprenol N-acetyl-beta-D-mannosaminyltransferase